MTDRYGIVRPLESGPDVRVYLVADKWESLNQKVLTLLPFDTSTEEARFEFENAYALRASIDHPLLIRLEDVAFRGRRIGVVTPFVPDTSITGHPSSPDQRHAVAAQLVQLLCFLHRRNFYCGYLNPSKLFLRSNSQLLANILFPRRLSSRPSADYVRYASPEFLDSGALSVKSDLYSLGMILYHLFTGQAPYAERDVDKLKPKQRLTQPARPRKLNPDIPAKIEELILELIEKKPELRPSSVEYVAEVLKHEAIRPAPVVPKFRSVLFGRAGALSRLRSVLDEHQSNPSFRFIAIGGPSGIGKTALTERLQLIAKIRGFHAYSAGHHSGGSTVEAFRELLARLITSDSVESPKPLSQGTTSHSELTGSLTRALKQAAAQRPVILCLNDLQWMDEGSLDIYRLLARSAEYPILFLGNYRTDEPANHWESLKSELSRRGVLTEIALGPLKRSDVKELASSLFGDLPPDELIEKVLALCVGNPFYVYEFLRSRHETGELDFESGHWRWCPSLLARESIPETITENIQARLGSLQPEQFELLAYLALADKPFHFDTLLKLGLRGADQLVETIAHLEHLDFVHVKGSLEKSLVTVNHDWISRVVRDQLKAPKRRAIHKKVAVALEKEYKQRGDQFSLVSLVRHFSGAGIASKVNRYVWPAIDWLEQNRFYRDAAQLLESAVELDAVRQENVRYVRKAIDLFYLSGQFDTCSRLCQDWLSAPNTPPANEEKVSIFYLLGIIAGLRGQYPDAVKLFEKARSFLDSGFKGELAVEVQAAMMHSLVQMGELTRARKLAGRLLDGLRREDPAYSIDRVYFALCNFTQNLGQIREGIQWNAKSIRLALDSGKYIRAAGRGTNLAEAHLYAGNFNLSQSLVRFSSGLASETGNWEVTAFAKMIQCMLYRKQGEHCKALCGLDELFALNERSNQNKVIESRTYVERALNLKYQLFPERALSWIEKCEPLSTVHENWWVKIEVTLALGWIWLSLGQPRRALQLLCELDRQKTGLETRQYLLLRGYAGLALGNWEQALKEGRHILKLSPPLMTFDRTSANLLLAEVFLVQGNLERAGKCILDAEATAKAGFFLPLMAKAYLLKAKWLFATGDNRVARVYCARALQVAKRVERPGLHAEIYHTLANIEAALEQREKAFQHLTTALQTLKQRSLHLSSAYRDSFSKHFIEPIEADRKRLFSDVVKGAPRYLIQLRDFATFVAQASDLTEIARKTSEAIQESVSGISLNIFLRQFIDSPFQLLASHGKCRRTGRHLLLESEHQDQLFAINTDGFSTIDERELGIPLRSQHQLLGLLYLERDGQTISETEVDFLSCIATVLEVRLGNLDSNTKERQGCRLSLSSNGQIVGEHPAIKTLLNEIMRIASTDVTVLITGESGTGKELVARAIHENSGRKQGRFVPINCAALPAELIESELFGHARGTFTGALTDKKGLFEVASGGTLFLDEVGSMPLALQSRLLRVLQDKKIRRLGETAEKAVDVRIVAASNQSLLELIQKQLFREDLYHRLNVCQLHLPPLRDRVSDIPLLVSHFVQKLNRREGLNKKISAEAVELLGRYVFPGNVRELENILESAYHLCSDTIGPELIGTRISMTASNSSVLLHPRSRAQTIVDSLAAGRADFWIDVKTAYLQRELSRSDVKEIISIGLAACSGRYRTLLNYFNIPQSDYKKFISFLTNQKCKVDFRRYRSEAVRVS